MEPAELTIEIWRDIRDETLCAKTGREPPPRGVGYLFTTGVPPYLAHPREALRLFAEGGARDAYSRLVRRLEELSLKVTVSRAA